MPIEPASGAPYTRFAPKIPVHRITSGMAPTIHRFFDTSPISPSGRWIALTEFPFEHRVPGPGERAAVIVLEVASGREIYRRATAAWDTQLGAQVQWGADDTQLLFNDLSGWEPHGVCVDIAASTERSIDGPVYMAAPDGASVISPCLRRIALIQPGYGVVVPQEQLRANVGFAEDDGIYSTNLSSGRQSLLVSIAAIRDALPELFAPFESRAGGFHVFHVKFNPQGTRIMAVLRWVPAAGAPKVAQSCLVTMDADGANIRLAVDFETWRGGHHPNWLPDGDGIIMNLAIRNPSVRFRRAKSLIERVTRRAPFRQMGLRYRSDENALRFARFQFDGSDLTLLSRTHSGSGHPSMPSACPCVLSDAYNHEMVAYADGTAPIRWLDTRTDHLDELVRIRTRPESLGPRLALRVDPHPAWDRSERRIVFNACPDGVRQVFIGDMASVLDGESAS